jgi:hypothetical protein
MSAVIENIKAELAAYNEKKKTLTEQLRTEFPALFSDLLAGSKRINSFSWTQYTPYFNDGDSCEFGVRNDDIEINGGDDEDGDGFDYLSPSVYGIVTADNQAEHEAFNAGPLGSKYYVGTKIGSGGKFPNPHYDAAESAIVGQIEEILGSIPDDFYEELFGDHVKVTVHKSGEVSVEEYDHD